MENYQNWNTLYTDSKEQTFNLVKIFLSPRSPSFKRCVFRHKRAWYLKWTKVQKSKTKARTKQKKARAKLIPKGKRRKLATPQHQPLKDNAS
jgi:hypothetical protein